MHQWIPNEKNPCPGWKNPVTDWHTRQKPKDAGDPKSGWLEGWHQVADSHEDHACAEADGGS
jgi:hypothetical protein